MAVLGSCPDPPIMAGVFQNHAGRVRWGQKAAGILRVGSGRVGSGQEVC